MNDQTAIGDIPGLLEDIRGRFANVESCPISGPRIFFENAGGALTLKSVIETSAKFAGIPDNQGRDNPASLALMQTIDQSKSAMRVFFNAPDGQFFVGESGTELLFRLIAAAILGSPDGGIVLGSTLEHPASRSACDRWAKVAGKPHVLVAHNDETGSVAANDYCAQVTPDTRVATILHTSPVTGMSVDVAGIAQTIRAVAPDCLIIVDGIQHASHGQIDIASYGIDGYVVSPYKVFARHGYGVAWISDRLAAVPHDSLRGGPVGNWDLGTRDTGAYATFSDVVSYFEWLGKHFTDATDQRHRIEAAGRAIHAHEQALTDAMLFGIGNRTGLSQMPGVVVLGGSDNPRREGLIAITVDRMPAATVVKKLNDAGIRTHIRKDDHYSGNILGPLGLTACIRISLCHYNSLAEVAALLDAMDEILGLN